MQIRSLGFRNNNGEKCLGSGDLRTELRNSRSAALAPVTPSRAISASRAGAHRRKRSELPEGFGHPAVISAPKVEATQADLGGG
jgi:hypothetical protein